MFEIDVIDQMWELEALAMSTREPMVVIEEALGEYERNQKSARGRSRNPFFWLALAADLIVETLIQIIGWIAEIPVRLLSRIFCLDQEKVARSLFGRVVTGLFGAICALIAALAGLFYVLEFLGFKDAVLRWLKLK